MIVDTLARAFGLVKPDDPQRYLRYLPVPNLPSSMQFTMDTALQLSVVWACVDVITKGIASSPWYVYENENDGGHKYIYDHRLHWMLNTRTNEEMTAIAFREALLYNGLTWGNGYAEIRRDKAGRVVEMWPLLPSRMVQRREPDPPYKMYFEYTGLDGVHYRLEAENVFHLKGPSITGLLGENIVARGAKSIALAIAEERFALSYYGNNTVVGTVLKYPGKLDPKSHERLRDEFDEVRKGADKAHKPLILEGGMELVQNTHDAEKSELINARTFSVEEICRWYGVPPHKVQHLLRATFNNIEHLGLEFVRDALTPWCRRLTQEADAKLFGKRELNKQTHIDTSWLSQGDAKSRAEAAQLWRMAGIKSANEIRREEGLNPIHGKVGEVIVITPGAQTLENVINPPEPKPASGLMPPKKGEEDPNDPGKKDLPPEPDEGETTDTAENVVHEAIFALFATAIDRYLRRLENRRTDLERHGLSAQRIELNLADERVRLRPWLVTESNSAMQLVEKLNGTPVDTSTTALFLAADYLDNGGDPRIAAERLLSSLKIRKELTNGL